MPSLSYLEIARLEEHRQAVATAEVADVSEEIAGGSMSFGGRGSWANQACGLGLAGPVSDAELDRLVDFYASRGVEPKIELCVFAHPTLVHGLAARGFQLREFENVLANYLDAGVGFRADWPYPPASGLAIRRVEAGDAELVRTYVEVSTSGFRPLDQPVPEVLDKSVRRIVEHDRNDVYVAYLDGEPAGGGALETLEGVSALSGTSVLSAYRRRGIQASLIVRRLERARERGSRVAVIHSRPGIPTERNAARLGFFMAYAKAVLAMPGRGLEPSP